MSSLVAYLPFGSACLLTAGFALVLLGCGAPSQPPAARGSASFMGVSTTNAQRVVYVIDASGAMVPYLQFIRHHLKDSLENLSDEQSFAIIFYQGGQAIGIFLNGDEILPPEGRPPPKHPV
jgi:hypothetical protein